MTDIELLRRVQSGDESAWGAIYNRYLPTVWRYVCARLDGNLHATEDVVSETMLGLVRSIGTLDPSRGDLAPWIFTIAKRKISDHLRRGYRVNQVVPLDENTVVDTQWTGDAIETRTAIKEVMNQLRDIERVALEWKYIEQLSVSEIAVRLDRTEKAVESILHRARRSFRSLFAKLSEPRDQ